MKIAYLVLAHENPRHLERLIRALAGDSSRVFVHLDRKSRRRDFAFLAGIAGTETVADPVAVHWADFSMVEAILALLRQALSHEARFERFVLLSGTDYPLRSQEYISRFFAAHSGTEFINVTPIPGPGKPLWRVTRFKHGPKDHRSAEFVRRALFRLGLKSRHRDHRPVFGALAPYGGDAWWALTREACEHIESFVQDHPHLVQYFQHTHFPDEMFFQTILGNSPFRERVQRSVTFVDWKVPGASHPAWLDASYVERFRASREFVVEDAYGAGEALFARKCPHPSDDLVALLDEMILEKDAALAGT